MTSEQIPQAPPKPAPLPMAAKRVVCDLCGHTALELHCKIRCLNCGYTRDCSDP